MRRSIRPQALASLVLALFSVAAQNASAQYLFCEEQEGGKCFTDPAPLPHNHNEGTSWTPCGGQPFTWLASLDFEVDWDYVMINGTSYDGAKSVVGRAAGTIDVSIHTDSSVDSPGLSVLQAYCEEDSVTYLEAECPDSGAGAYLTKQTSGSGYSGSGYLLSRASTTAAGQSVDRGTFSFSTAAGSYDLYFRVDTGGNGAKDSWFYRTDGGAWATVNNVSSLGTGWRWVKGGAAKALAAGQHSIELGNRESGLKIDKLAILPTGSAAPSGVGGSSTNCAPDVACGAAVCSNGDACCDWGQSGPVCYPSCRAVPSGQASGLTCDSHQDCGPGNPSFSTGCVPAAQAAIPGAATLCAGSGWSEPNSCAAGLSCRPAILGVSACLSD
jgi:hypothetical protein